ncbi:hypothetical protein MRX96_003091 [Rhipicephalus microplus]
MYPYLYDKRHPSFKDRTKKDRDWAEIGSMFGMSSAETVHVGGDHFKPAESSLEDDGVTRALTWKWSLGRHCHRRYLSGTVPSVPHNGWQQRLWQQAFCR